MMITLDQIVIELQQSADKQSELIAELQQLMLERGLVTWESLEQERIRDRRSK
jgi:hypothetical protein